MTIKVREIPVQARGRLSASRGFIRMTLAGWKASAIAASELVERNFELLKRSENEQTRAFLGWEIVSAGVELSELVATTLLHDGQPEGASFFNADNATIRTLFERTSVDGFSSAEALAFLRLRPSQDREEVAPVLDRIAHVAGAAVHAIADFWCVHVDDARWFRHLPMSLTMAEIDAVEPGAPGRDTVLEQIAAIPECLEVIALADAHLKVYEHKALEMEHVRTARSVVLVATQLVINWVANRDDPPKPWLFPTLTHDLSASEREILRRDGGYIIVDEIL